jgi:hypothetical protein
MERWRRAEIMTKLEILKATVPELLAAMKGVFKASESEHFARTSDLVLLIARMNRVYPKDVLEAAFLIAHVRFHRWCKDHQEILQIKEAIALESRS